MKPTLVLHAKELARHAKKIADGIARHHKAGCVVVPKRVSNPTLVAHGLVDKSRFHLVTHTSGPRRAVADLYAGSEAEAKKVATLLANMLGMQLDLLDNRHAEGKPLAAHRRINPSRSKKSRRARDYRRKSTSRKIRRATAATTLGKHAGPKETRRMKAGRFPRAQYYKARHEARLKQFMARGGQPHRNPRGRIVAFLERHRDDPMTGEPGILRDEWRVEKVPPAELEELYRRGASVRGSIGLYHRYIRRGVEEPWTLFDVYANRKAALDSIDWSATPVAADLTRMHVKRQAKAVADQTARERRDAAAARDMKLAGLRKQSSAAFDRMLASSNERYQQLALSWNDIVRGFQSLPKAQRERLRKNHEFKMLHDAVIEATTIPAKAKAIAAFMKQGRAFVFGRTKNPGARVVYNKLLGGWYVVTGPHQTPLNGRFNSKAEAQAWLSGPRSPNPKGPYANDPHVIANRYVAKIRNTQKRWYAERYADHLFQGAPSPEPPAGLSYMAAQAVRLQLQAIADSGTTPNPKGPLSVPDKHQLKIARDTLKMTETMARVMGGMTHGEAKRTIYRLTGKYPGFTAQETAAYGGAKHRGEVYGSGSTWYSRVLPEGTVDGPFDSEGKAWLNLAERTPNPKGPKPYIVGGKKRYATIEEATAAANEIHRKTGVFVSVEHRPAKTKGDPRTRSYPDIGTPVVGTITVKGTTYNVHRMSSKYTPWYLVGPRGAQFGLIRYNEKPWLFYAINASRPTSSAGKLEGVTFTGETFDTLAEFTDAGPKMNPGRRGGVRRNPRPVGIGTIERLRAELDDVYAQQWAKMGYTHERQPAVVKERRDFWAIDVGGSGAFMVRKSDGAIFAIKAYGVPNYDKGYGFADEMSGYDVMSAKAWRRDMKTPRATPGMKPKPYRKPKAPPSGPRSGYVPVAEAAKDLRAALKRHFPNVTFSVRSHSYAGGASIRVSYTNGPKTADVDKIAQRFSGATFDGMTDLKSSREAVLVGEDGTMRTVRYGSDYVFVERNISPTLNDAVIREIGSRWDQSQWASMRDYEKERMARRGVSAIDIPDGEPEAVTAKRAADAFLRGDDPDRGRYDNPRRRTPNPKSRKPGKPAKLQRTMTADQFVDGLHANADAYHEGRITHAVFHKVNVAIWNRIQAHGLEAPVLAILRKDVPIPGLIEPGRNPREARFPRSKGPLTAAMIIRGSQTWVEWGDERDHEVAGLLQVKDDKVAERFIQAWLSSGSLGAAMKAAGPGIVRGTNPARLPVRGEVWRAHTGNKYRILEVSRDRVSALDLSTGNRASSDVKDFVSNLLPPRTPNARTRNPKGRVIGKFTAQPATIARIAEHYYVFRSPGVEEIGSRTQAPLVKWAHTHGFAATLVDERKPELRAGVFDTSGHMRNPSAGYSDQLRKAYGRGTAAAWDDKPMSTNPYKKGGLRDAWDNGYRRGKELGPPADWKPSRTRNPRSHNLTAAEEKAAELRRMFVDRGPVRVRKSTVKAPKPLGKVAAKIGKLAGVIYEEQKFTDKAPKLYEHLFDDPKPVLVADPETQDLHIVRGSSPYKLTPDGIVH